MNIIHRYSWDGTAERAAEVEKAAARVVARNYGVIPGLVPAPHDLTLCEELGIVDWDVSDEYHDAVTEYLVNGHKNQNSYEIMVAKLAGLGRIKKGMIAKQRPIVIVPMPEHITVAPPSVLLRFANALRGRT